MLWGVGLIAVATVLVGCGSTDEPPMVTAPAVTEFVTAESAPSPEAEPEPSDVPADQRLRDGFAELSQTLAQPVGISIAPVGGDTTLDLGDQTAQVAWSTIKVPLALAAQRQNGAAVTADVTAAIISSDNAAAERLWASLGPPQTAAEQVERVLAEAGDTTTEVSSERSRPGFTAFGQTVWTLPASAGFTAGLPCLPDSGNVVDLMGRVDGGQQWGLSRVDRSVAVKGGWGPLLDGGYLVRQIGIITADDGQQIAVSMSTHAPGATMDSGIAALNEVGDWLNTQLRSLPRGRC